MAFVWYGQVGHCLAIFVDGNCEHQLDTDEQMCLYSLVGMLLLVDV